MGPFHQLSAIMFADISGYTSMMQENEKRALQHQNKFRDKLREEVLAHQGRVLEIRGDGALCSFTSTIEAVRAALAIQLEMRIQPEVPLRIGIHSGDVVINGNEIYGDGVNIASRMESFSIPGSIFISGKVYDDIKNQHDIKTKSLGKFSLKNVKDPVEIFAISNTGLAVPQHSNLDGKGEKFQADCLLVLPFVNLSNDPEQEYFSDGLTEELISGLSKLKEVRVISRTTSMKYKGTTKDTRTISTETDAGYIIEGSVRKQGNQLRITAQFIDASKDAHIWSENYRGTVDDIFDIQESVSSKIVEALRIQLTHGEQESLQKRYTWNPEAYQLYLQGRFFWNKRNEQGLHDAIRYFEKALEKDPGYALAWAGLADSFSLMGEYTQASRQLFLEKQMAAINKALSLDHNLGEPRVSFGISLMLNEWDWKSAEKEFKRGIALAPNYATGHHWYAELLLYTGRFAEAYREISKAVDLDPVSQGILKDKGIFCYYTGEYEKAISIAKRTLELDPGFAPLYRLLSISYEARGNFDKAIQENKRWGELTGDQVKCDIALAHIHAASGNREAALTILDRTPVSVLKSNDFRGIALVHAALGDKEKAFEWLKTSCQRHEESLCSLMIDPKFEILHDDPRYDNLLTLIGLADYKTITKAHK